MTQRSTEIISVYYLTSVAIGSCLAYGEGDGPKDSASKQDRSVEQNRPINMGVDLMYNKDAEDVASFKELIGEARQVFKDSENVCSHDQDKNNGPHHLRLLAFGSSKQDRLEGSSSIVLLGDIFDVRDVMPDHDKFSDKMSWVQLVSDNYRMDLLLTAKDRPFFIRPNDRFAVTFREDSKFIRDSGAAFRPGSFDAVMNGTLYKTLISDSSVHPTKTLDILYITFGDSFLKLRANAGEFKYFKNCKQLFILFQRLAFK